MTKLRDFLQRVNRSEVIVPDKVYQQIGVRVWGKGAYERDSILGSDTKYKTFNKVHVNDVIINKIWARNGSVAVVTEELDGFYCSTEFPLFVVNKKKASLGWVKWLLKTPWFWNQCAEKAGGTSGKKRIKPDKFLEIDVDLPSLEKQEKILQHLDLCIPTITQLKLINKKNKDLLQKLRRGILQKAISGKLVPQNPNEEPVLLLKKAKNEKKKQNIENKFDLKVGKQIINKETLVELPPSWIYAKLEDVLYFNPRNQLDDDLEVSFIPMRLISDGFRNKHTFEVKRWLEIKKGYTHFQENDVVVAKITPCFENRKSAIMTDLKNKAGAGTTELIVMRPRDELVLPRFILLVTKTDKFIEFGTSTFSGTAGQKRVNIKKIKKFLIGIPPLLEQKRILYKVNELMNKCNRLEEIIKKNQENSKLLIESILRESLIY